MLAQRIQAPSLRLLERTSERDLWKTAPQVASRLRWAKQNFFSSRYELCSDGRCVATMHMRGLFRPTATGVGPDGSWMFEPVGSAPGKIVVRPRDSYREEATFDLSFSDHGGILRLASGGALVLSSDFWKGRAEFQTLNGEAVVRYRICGVIRQSAKVEVLDQGKTMAELPWLLMLGWCLVVGYL